MIEQCSNISQLIVSLVAAGVATMTAVRKKTLLYVLAAGMLVTLALGILYWLTYQLIMGQSPDVFQASDFSWVASYLFLLAIELTLTAPHSKHKRYLPSYLPIAIAIALTIYFCQWGGVIMNILHVGILGICACCAMRNLHFGTVTHRPLHWFCLAFVATEYLLWISSCFWVSDTWTNPYFWFDFILTALIGLFYPLVKKVVEDDLS